MCQIIKMNYPNFHKITIQGFNEQIVIIEKYNSTLWLGIAGADPGFQKGGGTPKLSGENTKINDIHDPFD